MNLANLTKKTIVKLKRTIILRSIPVKISLNKSNRYNKIFRKSNNL